MTDPKHTEPSVVVTQAAQDAANALWAEHGPWKLGTINAVTQAFARFEAEVRTAAEAASLAREDALRGLIGDAYETLKRIEQGADESLVAAAAKEACDKIDAALSPAAKGGEA